RKRSPPASATPCEAQVNDAAVQDQTGTPFVLFWIENHVDAVAVVARPGVNCTNVNGPAELLCPSCKIERVQAVESIVRSIRAHCLDVDCPIRSARTIDHRRRCNANFGCDSPVGASRIRRLAWRQYRLLPEHGAVISVTGINSVVLCRD